MSEVVLPKFQFSNATVKTEDDLKALTPQSDKYFRPGLHTVTITKAAYVGKATDPNWGKIHLTYTGTGDKTILDSLLIPERDVVYVDKTGKKTGFLFTKFRKFASALGIDVQLSTLGDTMAENFSNVGKTLVGQTIQVEIGYQGNHVAYLGKTAANGNRYGIKMRDGSMIATADGSVLEFADVDSAKAHAEGLQLELNPYMNVLDYVPGTGAKLAAVKGW